MNLIECRKRIAHPLRQATLDFYFPHQPDWNQQVCVFLAEEWEGEPEESEEMAPAWFADDPLWLPKVLEGLFLEADFLFGEGDKVLEHEVREISG